VPVAGVFGQVGRQKVNVNWLSSSQLSTQLAMRKNKKRNVVKKSGSCRWRGSNSRPLDYSDL
jgi:hypothetical protein